MTDQHAKPPIVETSSAASSPPDRQEHCRDIVKPTITDPAGALQDGQVDDDEQWLWTVVASLGERSADVREALRKALGNGLDAGPLLGLDPANAENKRENLNLMKDPNHLARLNPLLGTICSSHVLPNNL
jgi:hypothetical protein